jgi:hypothetical protein
MSTEGDSLQVSVLPYRRTICPPSNFWGLLTNISHTRSAVVASLFISQHAGSHCWNFMYHSWIVLSIGGSVWHTVRNLHCTFTVNSFLANSKTQNTFLFPVRAMFRHDCSLVVKPASTPQHRLWYPSLRVQTRPKPSDFFGCKNPQHVFLWKGSKAVGPVSQICGTLGCCAAEFGTSGGTYEVPCLIRLFFIVILYWRFCVIFIYFCSRYH